MAPILFERRRLLAAPDVMRTGNPPAAGPLALPLAVAVGVLTLVLGASAADDGRTRVELEVAGLLSIDEGGASILVLREKGAKTILPVMLPGPTARELGRALAGRERRGVLGEAIEKLGGRVREVEIAEAEESPRGALIRLAQAGRPLELAARPSESVALAVAAGVPIVTTRKVIEESGLTPDDLARARDRLEGGGRGLRL